MSPRILWAVFSCLALVACNLEPAATAPVSDPQERARLGGEAFAAYCASCHGAGARGDGPVASRLRVPPADLTRIAVRAGGFDAPAVAAYIDGRNLVAEHGPSDMPVWGRNFDDRNQAMTDETRLHPGTIFQIVEYLRTIQVSE